MSAKRNVSKKKNLVYQVVEKLTAMYRPGRSKHEDKRRNKGKPLIDVIHSPVTLKNYIAADIRFVRYVELLYGKMQDIADCWAYVPAYLQSRIERGLSAETIYSDAKALAKLYGCGIRDLGVKLPKRGLATNTKNRKFLWTKYFDPRKYPELILVCKAFGLRRCEIKRAVPQQVERRRDGSVYLLAIKGKGGKIRDVDAVPSYAEAA